MYVFDGGRLDTRNPIETPTDVDTSAIVECVAKQELERVFACGQREIRFGLTSTKMLDVVRHRQRHVHVRHLIEIDQEMMMPGIRIRHFRRRNAHAFEAELHGDR